MMRSLPTAAWACCWAWCWAAALAPAGLPPPPPPPPGGWIGPYHGGYDQGQAFLSAAGAPNRTLQEAYGFGTVRLGNHHSYGRWSFREVVEYNCHTADVDAVWGGLVGPTEHGSISNPADTDPWLPAATLPGLVQAAHRWSTLSKSCPQIAGVEIDDFLNNFKAQGGPRHGAENASECARHWVGGCAKEWIGLAALREIKGALHGKPLHPVTGRVLHDAAPTTPHLRLAVCWYQHETAGFMARDGASELLGLIDQVVLSIYHQNTTSAEGYGDAVRGVRKVVGPNISLIR